MSLTNVVFTCLAGFVIFVSANQISLNTVLFNGDYEFIDLTHPFDNQTVYWPNVQNFVFTKKLENYQLNGTGGQAEVFTHFGPLSDTGGEPIAGLSFVTHASEPILRPAGFLMMFFFIVKQVINTNMQLMKAGEHGGTHIDAPHHFLSSGAYVGDIPLEKLILPLIIADVSTQTNDDPNFILYKQHLDYILNDNLGKPCVIIFKFGWSKYFNDRKKYLGLDEQKQALNFPGLSAEVAEWITTSFKNIVGVGVDVASVDPGSESAFPVHTILAKSGVYNLENVNLYRQIPEYGCTALVLPMKISQGTGAPLRLVAICPK